jgi:hypothetical protein
MGMMLFMASSNTIMQMKAPADLGGRVMSLRALTLFGVSAVGSFMMGHLAEIKHIRVHGYAVPFDVQGTVFLGASIGLISSLYFLLASRRQRAKEMVTDLAAESAGGGTDI